MKKFIAATAAILASITALTTFTPAAEAVSNPRTQLAPGCSWSQPFLQRCHVYSPSMGRHIDVDIRPSLTQNNPKVIQFLDGVGNPKPSGWLFAGHTLKHMANVDATLVFPYPAPNTWYADWDRPGANGQKHLYKTFMTEELPAYLTKHFNVPGGGVGHTGITGISAGAFGALSLASQRPDLYRRVVAMSGEYDPGMPMQRLIVDGSAFFGTPGAGHGPWTNERSRAKANPTLNMNKLDMPVDITVASGIHNFSPRNTGPEHPLASIFVGGPYEVGNVIFSSEFVAQAKARGKTNIRPFYDPIGTHSWDTWRRNAWDRKMILNMANTL